MTAGEIMVEADKLLQKWNLYSVENRTYIENMFNGSNRYDMMLNVDVMQKQARIYMLERGVIICEYRTTKKEVVIYVVIRDIIERIVNTFIWDSYADEKGRLHFTGTVHDLSERMVDEAFLLMGEPYADWNKQGISMYNLDKIALFD
ncbi:MAG: hypothetical protein IKJ39_04090 [Lachnospiraceae bacterium]|nr:hypothetical protein [Lachnospiraceae bacterium]